MLDFILKLCYNMAIKTINNNNMTNTTCGKCGDCKENGRLWIDGYHGKKALDFNADSSIIQSVAAFKDYGFNISECCAPVIKATVKNIMNQMLLPVTTTTQKLTKDLNVQNFLPDDTKTITSTSSVLDTSVTFDIADMKTGFLTFFDDTNLTVCNANVIYTVTVTGNDDSNTFSIIVKISFQDNTSTELASYTITSNTFTIGTSPVTISFTPSAPGTSIVIGDSILTFTQFPIFSLEGLINNTDSADVVTLRVIQHLITSCKTNTLTDFMTCNQANCTP